VTDANGKRPATGTTCRETWFGRDPVFSATYLSLIRRGNKIKATDADNIYQTVLYDSTAACWVIATCDLLRYVFGGGTSYVTPMTMRGDESSIPSSSGTRTFNTATTLRHETSSHRQKTPGTATAATVPAASGLQIPSMSATFAYERHGRQSRQTVIVDNQDPRGHADRLLTTRWADSPVAGRPVYQLTIPMSGSNNRTAFATHVRRQHLAVQNANSNYPTEIHRNEVLHHQWVETTGAVQIPCQRKQGAN